MAATLSVTCTQNSQSVSNNSSNVTVKAIIKWTYGSWNGDKRPGSITVNGTTYKFSKPFNTSRTTSGSATLAYVTVNVPHNANGSKTVKYSAKYSTGISSGVIETNTMSKVLTTIPRQAKLSSAPDFNDEANPVIKYSNPAGGSVTSLQAGIFNTDGTITYAEYRKVSETGSSYTFNLTDAERKKLRQACPTANSMNLRFYLKTVIGGNTYRGYLTKKLNIVNALPNTYPTVVNEDTNSLYLTGNDPDIIIKGFNRVKCSYNATPVKESELISLKVVSGNKYALESRTYGSSTVLPEYSILDNVESGLFTFTVKDSRGNEKPQPIEKTLIEYIPLTCDFINSRPTADGEMIFTIAGNYFNGAFGINESAISNSLKIEWRYKQNNGEYGEWTEVIPTIENNTYSYTKMLTGLDYQSTYTFQARAQDELNKINSNYITTKEIAVKCKPLYDWGEDDFAFNIPVIMNDGYNPIPLNSETDLDTIKTPNIYSGEINDSTTYLNCPITTGSFELEVSKLGNGQIKQRLTTHKQGSYQEFTRIYYDETWGYWRYNSWGNKILAGSINMYMAQTHTVNLNAKVSEQRNGIVLVWSAYKDSAAQNYNWCYTFVPKYHVQRTNGSGSGVTCICAGTGFTNTACKYVYVYDNKITGTSSNVESGTTNGITWNNKLYVLRYVIGV